MAPRPTRSAKASKAPKPTTEKESRVKDETRPRRASQGQGQATAANKEGATNPPVSRKRKHALIKEEPDSEAMNHPPTTTTKRRTTRKSSPIATDLDAAANLPTPPVAELTAHAKKTKPNPYNLTPGTTPYPLYPRPTPSDCHTVTRILTALHGRVSAPAIIPMPSLSSSGCGEVPSVLDALIRTRLSAATNGANSSRAFRGLVERFGIIPRGVGKGSVDWNRVRTAERGEVFEAIKSGGLADVKSRDIQRILQMVWDEGRERAERVKEEEGGVEKQEVVKDEAADGTETAKVDAGVLSLDHLHALSSEAAFQHLLTYPGIGPKTASCVLLFCLRRPSFAVDTHVFRLVSWLGWVPTAQEAKRMSNSDEAKKASKRGEARTPPVTRNTAYAHLDVRIPDELKYALHYLLIRHGKECPWCSAKMGAAARVREGRWKDGCPLDHLMKRAKKSEGVKPKGKKVGSKAKDASVEEEDDDESSGLSELEEQDVAELGEDEGLHSAR